ncbi:MAG: DUF1326 domain-containing protein [Thermoanaerobaculia bacterium]|nr:DUF1326 domain-containing protein [Thermoanaerobaculia bacterium]
MSKIPILAALLSIFAPLGAHATLSGHYLEARTADVYTGPCFANSESGLTGREATLAWSVDTGSWEGSNLAGLSVVAVVRADGTLGNVERNPVAARSLIFVDERADAAQRQALVSFVRERAGEVIGEISSVEAVPIELDRTDGELSARLAAGTVVRLATRPLTHQDHVCGNEFVYYPPLADGVTVEPAATTEHSYTGSAFGASWTSPGKRSAFVGSFGG